MSIISFISIISLSASFILNTLDKWKVFEKAEVYHGSKWYLPLWLRVDCMHCISFWLCMLIGAPIIIHTGLPYHYIFFAVISQPLTLKLINI
jgi:hypothetical protein